MKLTVEERSTIIIALKELKKIELKDAETFAGIGEKGKDLAERCRARAAEADALIKKITGK